MDPPDRCYTRHVGGRLVLLVAAIVAALVALGIVGARVLAHDRGEMYDGFAQNRREGLEEAAGRFEKAIHDIGEDLQLASSLLGAAETERLADRELDAIATIKREYLVMDARGPGEISHVVEFGAPPNSATLARPTLDRMLETSITEPGKLHVSGSYGAGQVPPWFRVFARDPQAGGPPVAVLVDMAVVLEGLDLQRNPSTRAMVIAPDGVVTPVSDPQLVSVAQRERWTTSGRGELEIGPDLAAAIGLPRTTAVVTNVAFHVGDAQEWRVIEVASTTALAAQERRLVRRVFVGAALVLGMLLAAGVYVIRNARRAAELRERIRNADRLAHLTEKAEKILDHIPSGVLAVSEDGRITAANRRFVERFQDVTGRKLDEAFGEDAPREDVVAIQQLVAAAVRTHTPQSIHRAAFRVLGEDATFSIHAVALERAVADVSALIVFEDVTQMRHLEDRIVRSEKLVTAGQLAAGIAHEIGTPLNVARGRLELVMSHLGSEHPEVRHHQIVIDQIDRVTRLIHQLLDFVRPSPGTIRRVELASILTVVHDLVVPEASKRDIAIAVNVPAAASTVRVDADQVQQIVVNLVLNAIDACDRGGHIAIGAKAEGSNAIIEVADDGHGIPAEAQARVFDPFFTTKKRGQGTGLGLWVVAQLVRASSGDIELESAAGRGTTVRVTWPVAT